MLTRPPLPTALLAALGTLDAIRLAAKARLGEIIADAEQHRLAGLERLLASGLPPRIARIPITNARCGCDYTARIGIGSEHATADVILDTGSSSLAVSPSVYDGQGDANLVATADAQIVHYGIGGWAGPAVTTSVGFGPGVTVRTTRIALWSLQEMGVFKGATGIMGLAYSGLNSAYDLTPWFEQEKKASTSYPWPFPETDFATFATDFKQLRKQYGIHSQAIAPYFDDLESNGVVANRFAFHTLRSSVSQRGGSEAAIVADPLNHGWFVLGGGVEQTDLYEGAFVELKVLDDLYYNTNLRSVQVDGCAAVAVQPLQAQFVKDSKTNAIIDSGTSVLYLAADVYAAITGSLRQLDASFGAALDAFAQANRQQQGLPVDQLRLEAWPNIHFVLEGTQGEDVRLTCTPQTYWQVDYPVRGQASFQVIGPLEAGDANQSVLGLPLMNNYYTVFDRSQSTHGVVKFAPIRRPEGA